MSDEQTASAEEATDQTTMADVANKIQTPAESANEQSQKGGSTDNVEDFKQFAEKLNQLTEKVESTASKADELANSQQAEALNKEIAKAVERINENVGADTDMAELFAEKQARDNPDFKKVWENRHANPEALDQALDILNREWASKNQVVIDPSVAENQRALRESQKTGGSVQIPSEEDKLANMSDAEFKHHMRKLARS